MVGLPVYLAEVSILKSGSASLATQFGWAVAPWSGLSLIQNALAATATIYASDVGYRTRWGEFGTFTRASQASYANTAGILSIALTNVLRNGHYTGWRQNLVRNSSGAGVVAGTPGTLPTNWSINLSGLTQQVTGFGTLLNGMPFVDIHLSGVTTTTFIRVNFEATNVMLALQGQQVAISVGVGLIVGGFTGISAFRLNAIEYDASGAALADNAQTVSAPTTSDVTRYSSVRTVAQATAAFVGLGMQFTTTVGAAVDFTVRFVLPQVEYGATVTDAISTSGTATAVPTDTARTLVEPAATNLLLQSQNLVTSWTVGFLTSAVNAAVAPDGTTTATSLIATVTSAEHSINQVATLASNNQPVTLSIFVKAASSIQRWVSLVLFDQSATGNNVQQRFDLVAGVMGTSTVGGVATLIGATMTRYPNNWFRITLSVNVSNTAGHANVITRLRTLSAAQVTTYAGDAVSGIFAWGAQFELGSAATSYIATTTAAVTRAADVGSVQPYVPILTEGFQINRAINLDPTSAGASAAWGNIVLQNSDGSLDAISSDWSADRRTFSIKRGVKTISRTRGIFNDPSYSTFATYLTGLAGSWFLGDDGLEISLRDASYWLDAPIQSTLYAGTGTYEGTAALTSIPKPKARGGTSGNPIRNVTPVLIDPVALIYQYTDGPGTVVTLYEGGATTITFASNTTNLYAGTTPAGQYRTDNSRGLFQLGSVPASGYTITADITGSFPIAGAITAIAYILQFLLTEDMGLTSDHLDLAGFTALNASAPYISGWWWGPVAAQASVEIPKLLTGIGGRLLPRRDGTLRPYLLRPLGASPTIVAAFNTTNIISLTPRQLPSTISPPPFRIRVGYNHNFTVQTSGINAASASPTQQLFVTLSDQISTYTATAVIAAYAKPNDPDPIVSPMLVAANATTVALLTGQLFGDGAPRLYDLVVPVEVGITVDLGDAVSVRYPFGDLRSGQTGLIVEEQFVSSDATMTLTVLI